MTTEITLALATMYVVQETEVDGRIATAYCAIMRV